MCNGKECPYEDPVHGNCTLLIVAGYEHESFPVDAACKQREVHFRNHLIWEQKNRKEKHK